MSASRNRSAGLHEATLRKLRVKREPRGPYMVSADDFDYETGEALWDKPANFRGRGRGRGNGGRWGGNGGQGGRGRGQGHRNRGDRRDYEDDPTRTNPWSRPRRRQRYKYGRPRRDRRYDSDPIIKQKDDGSYSLFDDKPDMEGNLPFANGGDKAGPAAPVSYDPGEDENPLANAGDMAGEEVDALAQLQAKLARVKEDAEEVEEALEDHPEPQDVVLEQRQRRKKKKKKKKDKAAEADPYDNYEEPALFAEEQYQEPPLFAEEEITQEPAEVQADAYSLPLTVEDLDPLMDLDEIDVPRLTSMYSEVYAIVSTLKPGLKRKEGKLLMKRIKIELEERQLDAASTQI